MEYNIIFQRIFNDIPFIRYYRLEDIPYSGVICNPVFFSLLDGSPTSITLSESPPSSWSSPAPARCVLKYDFYD